MDVVIPHDTVLESLTELPIQFRVQVDGLTIPSLKPAGKQLVNASEILKISRRIKYATWSIKVLIDKQFSGLKLEAIHFLDYGLITFEFQRIENGKYILVAEGVKAEKSIDMFLRMGRGIGNLAQRNRIWKKRNFEVIAKAPPEFARTLPQTRVRNIRSNVDAIVLEATLDSNMMTSPPRKFQAEFNISQDSVKHKEVNPSRRKTTTGDTTLAGSIPEREERVPRFSGQHMEYIEYCHHPDSTHSPFMDSFEYIFLFVLALIIVSFFMVQL